MFLNGPGRKLLPTMSGNSWLNVVETQAVWGEDHPRAPPTLLSRNPLNEGILCCRLPLANGEHVWEDL